MTPDQFRDALAELRLTWLLASEHIGIGMRTVACYASGETPIPAPVARLLRLWVEIANAQGRKVRLPFA